jgi:hypothetical protein
MRVADSNRTSFTYSQSAIAVLPWPIWRRQTITYFPAFMTTLVSISVIPDRCMAVSLNEHFISVQYFAVGSNQLGASRSGHFLAQPEK